jgi:hypothetical protein
MRIRVGTIGARCEFCGCEEFQPLLPGALPANELVCFECAAPTSRRALLTQIADETVRRAERLLEHSRKH